MVADGQLLARFLRHQEADAFATLVQRHGPMVLGLCRRLLRDSHAADDAFQATFLVLARKAGSVRRPDALGNWLYGVAYRVAGRLRHTLHREQDRHPEPLPDVPQSHGDPVTAVIWRELQPILDEELGRLPDKYRAPLVLCHLEGKSPAEAARALGWPSSSLGSRLARAEELLRSRLANRGVALSAGLLWPLLAGPSKAAPSAALIQATVKAVTLWTLGQAIAGDGISGVAVALADAFHAALVTARLKVAVVSLLLVGLLGTLVGLGLFAATGDGTAGASTAPEVQAAPEAAPAVRADLWGDPLPDGALARLGTVRWRHGTAITELGFAAEGTQLITAGNKGVIRVWDVATGKQVRQFGKPLEYRALKRIVLSANGETVAALEAPDPDGDDDRPLPLQDKVVRVWRTATGEEVCQVRVKCHQGDIPKLALRADGRVLATKGRERIVQLWDTATGQEVRRIDKVDALAHHGNPLTFAPDGKVLALGCYGGGYTLNGKVIPSIGRVQLYDTDTGRLLRQLERTEYAPQHLSFAPDGKQLAWSGNHPRNPKAGSSIIVYDATTGTELLHIEDTAKNRSATAPVFLPDGQTLAFRWSQEPGIRFLDLRSGKEARSLARNVDQFALSADGKLLAVHGTGDNGSVRDEYTRVRLWDAATGEALSRLDGPNSPVMNLALSPDGKVVTTGAWQENILRQWDTASGKEIGRFQLPDGILGFSAAPSPDGQVVAYLSKSAITLCDTATGKQRYAIGLQDFGDPPHFFFSPNSKLLIRYGEDQPYQIREAATGKKLSQIPAPKHSGMHFAADHVTLAVTSPREIDKRRQFYEMALWETVSGRKLRQVRLAPSIESPLGMSPDGRSLVCVGPDQQLVLVETATGKIRQQLACPRGRVAFAPDGKVLAVVTGDWGIRLWDPLTGKEIGRFDGHRAPINDMKFTADGQRLISGSNDATVLVWDMGGLLRNGPVPPGYPQVESLWNDLAAGDAPLAFRAIAALAAVPEQAVPLLDKRLRPVPAIDRVAVERRIADLDSPQFTVRQQAVRELEELGERAAEHLQKRLADAPPLEVRQRVEQLLEKIGNQELSADQLRVLRAVEVLETIGTAAARQVLDRLARGASGARLTDEAKYARDRLAHRAVR